VSISKSLHGTNLNDNTGKNNNAFNLAFAEIGIPSVSQAGSVTWESQNLEFHRVMDASNLKKIDVQFYYTNTSDELFPLPFELFFSSSVKLIFRKRHHLVTCN